jgi:hypothetical protein
MATEIFTLEHQMVTLMATVATRVDAMLSTIHVARQAMARDRAPVASERLDLLQSELLDLRRIVRSTQPVPRMEQGAALRLSQFTRAVWERRKVETTFGQWVMSGAFKYLTPAATHLAGEFMQANRSSDGVTYLAAMLANGTLDYRVLQEWLAETPPTTGR